ncbi:MAG: BLUF domain-containing protein [Rhizobiales bacterium]|nr:BLUF domain-containing protein [Hyphomicrobiales bacterium]
MGLFRVVYHSRNRLKLETNALADHVANILSVSAARNCDAGVTGGLIYHHTWFIQVLEGEREAVIRKLERISQDPRHTEIAVMDASVVETRRFSSWWMAGAGWQEKEAGLFLPVVGAAGFDPRDLTAGGLIDLVERVVHHRAPSQGRTAWTTRSATTAA